MMRCPFRCLLVLGLLGFSPVVHAQAFSTVAPPARFGNDNPQLKDILQLQYQMQLLKRLIERERVANNMVSAAIAIGTLDPTVPKPDRDLCTQVPANIACATAYDDLYPGYSVKPIEKPVIAAIPPSLSNIASLPGSMKDAANAAIDALGMKLFWTDVTCLQKKCSAIISPKPSDPAARYRVSVGEKLPDGSVVDAISASGVTLMRGKKAIKLEPAPAV
jgi:hypothetical protein